MPRVTVRRERCKGCLLCVGVCPAQCFIVDAALNERGVKPVKVKDGARCTGCLQCVLMCPDCGIEIKEK